MANLTATSAWSDVLQLETTHQAIGGAGGTMNLQAQSLINRTQYLADNKFNTADFLTTLKTNLNASGSAPVYACRAWVNFNGTGTVAIRGSGNVSSITDGGVGTYTVNFTTAIQDVNYSVVGFCTFPTSTAPAGLVSVGNDYIQNTSNVTIKTSNSTTGAVIDSSYVNVTVTR